MKDEVIRILADNFFINLSQGNLIPPVLKWAFDVYVRYLILEGK